MAQAEAFTESHYNWKHFAEPMCMSGLTFHSRNAEEPDPHLGLQAQGQPYGPDFLSLQSQAHLQSKQIPLVQEGKGKAAEVPGS